MDQTKKGGKKQGFSLLETMLAISILLFSIVGPLNLASTSIKAFSLAKNNLIAGNLAQEGLELIRNYRDNNVLAGRGWLDGLNDCVLVAGCGIDAVDLTPVACDGGAYCVLNLNSSLYAHSAGEASIFSRKINITEIAPDQEAKVRVSISWRERFGSKSVELEEYLLNWE